MSNYMEMKSLLPSIRRHFVFFDDMNNSSLSLLYRNKVKIKFKKAARRKDEKYLIVFCDVRRKDVEKFIHQAQDEDLGVDYTIEYLKQTGRDLVTGEYVVQ